MAAAEEITLTLVVTPSVERLRVRIAEVAREFLPLEGPVGDAFADYLVAELTRTGVLIDLSKTPTVGPPTVGEVGP